MSDCTCVLPENLFDFQNTVTAEQHTRTHAVWRIHRAQTGIGNNITLSFWDRT